ISSPAVDFCGYSIPHPSEFKIHLRIQTDGSITATEALMKGLDDLIELCEHVETTFNNKLKAKGIKTSDVQAQV
ncbi:putative RNA polymerase I 16 kDa polypeptide, partial [Blyttiomyces helicus]